MTPARREESAGVEVAERGEVRKPPPVKALFKSKRVVAALIVYVSSLAVVWL